MTKSRGIHAPRVVWLDEQLAMLQQFYPDHRTEDLATMIGKPLKHVYRKAHQLGLAKSAAYLASPAACRLRRGDNVGAEHRFQKGAPTWNKGMNFTAGGRSAETRFKPGTAPPNQLPVGHIRTNSDGYQDIKVAPGPRQWVPLHRWNWKQAHGKYPARGMTLIFKDGNRKNCALENLELISRSDLMKRNTIHNMPKEMAELVQLRGALNRQINKRSTS